MGQIKQVVRRLSRSPLFTVLTLLTLAVGIGANTAIFSVVNGILLKPLPYPEPDRLMSVWLNAPGLGVARMNASPATCFTFREEGKTLQESGIWRRNDVSVTGLAEPERVHTVDVSGGVLPALGIQPMLGRVFTLQDDAPGSPETIVLTYGYWRRRFGADPGVIGRRILVDSRAREVIGVMPPNFRFLNVRAEILMPLQLNRSEVFIGQFSYQGVARLKPGVSVAQANADLARTLPLMRSKFRMPPGMNDKMLEQARLAPDIRPLKRDVVGDIGKVLWVIMGTLGIVLFIACANVANLLLVRAEGRQQELAVRAALGAGWGRIAQDLLLESLLLGAAGGALGLALAYAAIRMLIRLGPTSLPRLDEITLDLPVLLFTVAISLFAGLTFGLIPVFKYASPAAASRSARATAR